MQFATTLIEYLVSGVVALGWLALLVMHLLSLEPVSLEEIASGHVTMLLPMAYVLGIFVDTAASFCVQRIEQVDSWALGYRAYSLPRKLIRGVFRVVAGTSSSTPYVRSAEILSHSPSDLASVMATNVSRDRIARGVMFNTFLALPVFYFCGPSEIRFQLVTICAVVFVCSVLVYGRLRRLTHQFKVQALASLSCRNQD